MLPGPPSPSRLSSRGGSFESDDAQRDPRSTRAPRPPSFVAPAALARRSVARASPRVSPPGEMSGGRRSTPVRRSFDRGGEPPSSMSPSTVPESMLTSIVWPICRSRTNTSKNPLVSPGTRFVAPLSYATQRPLAEIAGA